LRSCSVTCETSPLQTIFRFDCSVGPLPHPAPGDAVTMFTSFPCDPDGLKSSSVLELFLWSVCTFAANAGYEGLKSALSGIFIALFAVSIGPGETIALSR
jgi:hypothetical protein